MNTLHREAGASLVELVIAVLIMGLFGTAVVAGVVAVRSSSSALYWKQQALVDLETIAQRLQRAEFKVCSAGWPQPYDTNMLALSPSTTPALSRSGSSVELTVKVVSDAPDGAMVKCDASSSIIADPTTAMSQLLTVTVTYDGYPLTKSILKTRPWPVKP